jgi:hypothetical protein
MKMWHGIPAAFALALLLSGCGQKPDPQNVGVTGKNVVVILSEDSQFKDDVVDRVIPVLEKKGFRVLRDDTDAAGGYRAAAYGAVVYIAQYQMWHTPLRAKRYFHRNGESQNILFVITCGDPKATIKKPFDAVTSASTPNEVDRVASEVLARLTTITGK